jgi:hypothetical protein
MTFFYLNFFNIFLIFFYIFFNSFILLLKNQPITKQKFPQNKQTNKTQKHPLVAPTAATSITANLLPFKLFFLLLFSPRKLFAIVCCCFWLSSLQFNKRRLAYERASEQSSAGFCVAFFALSELIAVHATGN